MNALKFAPIEAVEARACECDLRLFIKRAWHVVEPKDPYQHNWHIDAMCEHLVAVTKGQIRELIINIPPGCMKSLLTGVFWPAWEWTTDSSIRWLHSSYSDALPIRDNGKLKALVNSDWYKRRWKTRLTRENDTKLQTDGTGWKIASGIGGLSTGEHPHRKILDDPHKVMEAESEAERQKVIEFIDGVLPSRGAGINSATVLIMQRIGLRDASEHLIEQGGWTHVSLPMEYEHSRRKALTSIGWEDPRKTEGERLWPGKFTDPIIAVLKVKMKRRWHGQYQQNPQPPDGAVFQRDWFKVVKNPPSPLVKVVRAWDRAATVPKDSTDPDYTAGIKCARMESGQFIFLDVKRMRKTGLAVEEAILHCAENDEPRTKIVLPQDPGQAGKDQADHMTRKLAGKSFRMKPVTGDKLDRAQPLADYAEAGNVLLLEAPWNRDFLYELELFDGNEGAHDDQVDAAADAFNECAKKSSVGAS